MKDDLQILQLHLKSTTWVGTSECTKNLTILVFKAFQVIFVFQACISHDHTNLVILDYHIAPFKCLKPLLKSLIKNTRQVVKSVLFKCFNDLQQLTFPQFKTVLSDIKPTNNFIQTDGVSRITLNLFGQRNMLE